MYTFQAPRSHLITKDPTWNVHIRIFEMAGVPVKRYRFFSKEKLDITFDDLLSDLEDAPHGSAIIVQPVGLNYTLHVILDSPQSNWTKYE